MRWLVASPAVVLAGCSAIWTPLEPAGHVTPLDAGAPIDCPPLQDRVRKSVAAGTLAGEEIWSCETTYVLEGQLLIESTGILEIGPGTHVLTRPGAMLLAAAGLEGGWLIVRGRAEAPVVFTPEDAEDREPGAWRGIVLLGADDTNLGLDSMVPETLPEGDPRGVFGESKLGEGELCGDLHYLRVEYAGGRSPAEGLPLAGLTFAGCGGSTDVDHVQVHRSSEGIALYGGDIDLRQVVVSGSEYDGIEWTGGYSGDMQYVLVQQPEGAGAALKGYNRIEDSSARPLSRAEVVNATLIGGSDATAGAVSREQTGVVVAQGTSLTLTNSLVLGFLDFALDVRGVPEEGAVQVIGNVFHGNGRSFPDGAEEPPDSRDDDAGFDESAAFEANEAGNVMDDPELGSPRSLEAPDFRPFSRVVEQPALDLPRDAQGKVAPFFEPTGYAGAFAVANGQDDERTWISGWTRFTD